MCLWFKYIVSWLTSFINGKQNILTLKALEVELGFKLIKLQCRKKLDLLIDKCWEVYPEEGGRDRAMVWT